MTAAIVNDGQPACSRRRHRSSNGGRIGAERGSDEDLHRLSLGPPESGCGLGRRDFVSKPLAGCQSVWLRQHGSIGRTLPVRSLRRTVSSRWGADPLAIAQEAALKLKEICNLHAEAYSGAEFQHGPIALVTSGYPILIFMPGDESAELLSALAADLCRKKASRFHHGHDDLRGRGAAAGPPARSSGNRCGLLDTKLLRARHSHGGPSRLERG